MNSTAGRESNLLLRALNLVRGLLADSLEPKDDFAWVVLHHLGVASRDAEGVRVLCEQGLSDLALLVLRRLWENTIQLEYIRAAPETRTRQFLEEAWVEEYRTFTNARRRAASESSSSVAQALLADPRAQKKLQELESLKGRVSEDARQRAEKSTLRPLWRLSDMTRELGVEDQFRFLYSFLSQRAHVGVDLAKDYWRKEQSGGAIRLEASDYSSMALGLACAWLLSVALVFAERYAPSLSGDIQRLLDELSAGTE